MNQNFNAVKKLATIVALVLWSAAVFSQNIDCQEVVELRFDKYDSIMYVTTKKAFLYAGNEKFYLRFMVASGKTKPKFYFISELPSEMHVSPVAHLYFETSQGKIVKLTSNFFAGNSNNRNEFEATESEVLAIFSKEAFPVKSVALTHLQGRIESEDVNLLNYYLKNCMECALSEIERFFGSTMQNSKPK